MENIKSQYNELFSLYLHSIMKKYGRRKQNKSRTCGEEENQ